MISKNYGIYNHFEKGTFDLESQKHILQGVNLINYGDVSILPLTPIESNMHMIHDTFKNVIDIVLETFKNNEFYSKREKEGNNGTYWLSGD